MKLVKWLLLAVLALSPSLGAAQSFFTDRAVGTSQFNGFTGLVPLSYAQVRVCTLPTAGNPCNTPATIYDSNGTLLPINGGNFGQVTTDVVGRFSFQAVTGNYQIQVAATGSNTPQLNYPVSIGTTSNIFSVLNGVRYAAYFAGADSAAKILAACNDAGAGGVVVASFGMAAGDPVSLPNGCWVMDYRSGAKDRIFVGTGATIREASSYATNIGNDNPFGRFQVYSEIGCTPNTNGIPLGNDCVFLSQGAADVHIKNIASDTTSTTSVGAPGSVTITVGTTANFYLGAAIIIDPGGANEETITAGNWSKPSGTTVTATFANTHVQPYPVRQVGGTFIDSGLVKVTGDGKHLFVNFVEGQNNIVFQYPTNTASAWPDAALKIGAVETGLIGANKDRVTRNNTAASAWYLDNFANSGHLIAVTESSASAMLKLGNPTNQSVKELALADARRSYGGGTSGAYLLYPQQGGVGTNGVFKFRNNDFDDTDSLTVTTSTQITNAVKLTVGSGSTISLYKTVTDSPGAITVNAGTCTDRGVALAGSGTGATISVAANYALEANLVVGPAQTVAGTAHYRICNVQAAGNITLAAGATFNLAVVQ